jgi:hypothetical protein
LPGRSRRSVAPSDRQIAAFDVASFAQSFAKYRNQTFAHFGRTEVKVSNHWHRRRLRPRRERPRRRTTKPGNELAPSHHRSPTD